MWEFGTKEGRECVRRKNPTEMSAKRSCRPLTSSDVHCVSALGKMGGKKQRTRTASLRKYDTPEGSLWVRKEGPHIQLPGPLTGGARGLEHPRQAEQGPSDPSRGPGPSQLGPHPPCRDNTQEEGLSEDKGFSIHWFLLFAHAALC